MKRIIFIILLTLAATILQAQSLNFKWAKQMGGTGAYAIGGSIAVDAVGNVYTTGYFGGTADFDPGPGTYNLTSAGTYGMFISKLDSSGNFIWAKQMGGNSSLDIAGGSSITLDAAGNIYSTGTFEGTVDFDPGPGVFTLNANGIFRTRASFVLKLDADGNFIWAKQTGGGTEWGGGRSIVTDAAGNVYTSGTFEWVQDFDPGPAIFNLDGEYIDIYITKFDADGNFIWAKAPEETFSGNGIEGGYIALDAAGNIYCTGDFFGKADFDPGAGVFTLNSVCGSKDIFVWKLTNDGNFVWVKQIGGGDYDAGFGIAVDQSGNVYTSGVFSSTADFDPGPGIYSLTTGAWLAGVYGGNHLFLSKLNTNGDFVWAKMDYYGASYGYGHLVSYTAENIYTTGEFQNTVDFDPGPGIYNLTSFGDDDIFVRKVGKCTGSTSNTLTVTDCKGYMLNGYTYTNSGIYTQTITNSGGCDSIITLNLTIDNTISADYADEYVSTCGAYTWRCHTYGSNCSATTQCLTFKSSGVYKDTVISPNTCDSIITLHLTIIPQIFSTITQSICNGQTYDGHGGSGTYIDTLVAANGCDSIRTLQLTVSPKFSTIVQTICDGQTYDGHGNSGTYYIDTLVATNGCDSIITLQLTVLPKPAPYLGADTALCTGTSIQLYPGQFSTYTWQDGSAQNHFTVTQPGLYSVIVSNSCGSGSDEIIIKEGICDIYFPLAFTPNNDGKNDLFKILGAQNLKDYHLAVYNRYGQKVFETNDYTKGWTGNVKGQLQNTGVYVWYCNFKKSSSQENIVMKGTVVLIR